MHVCMYVYNYAKLYLCIMCVYIIMFVITYIHSMYVYDCLWGLITDTINLPVAVLSGAVECNAGKRKGSNG